MTDEQKLHKWLRGVLEPCDYQRIENFMSGFPDVNVCCQGSEVWCELKVVTKDRTLLRKEQYAWGMRRASAGGSVFVVSWDPYIDMVLIWKFPRIEIELYGEYLSLTPLHCYGDDKNSIRIKTILFPNIT